MLRDGEVASPAAFWKETPALSRGFLLSWERLLRPEGLGALLWELMESGPVCASGGSVRPTSFSGRLEFIVKVWTHPTTPSKTGETACF